MSPFVIAMGRVSLARFAVLDGLGAAIWAIAFGALGYLFGSGVQLLSGRVKQYEQCVFLGLAVVGLVVFLSIDWRRRHRRRARRTDVAAEE